MADFERIRETIDGSLDPDYLTQRQKAGWRLVGIEWERESAPASSAVPAGPASSPKYRVIPAALEGPPYGSKVAGDCARLEDNPDEMEFLLSLMELIIQDISISKVAEELNRKGYRTRRGTEWGPVGVFNMLPRLIELTPKIFATEEWVERRKRLTPVY